MTELLTSAQMRAIEAAAIASGAVTGLELMERAGRGVVDAVFAEWPELAAGSFRAVVLCGPGNNGGDGFVVARLLSEWGWKVEVFLYGNPEKLPPDARVNYERWCGMGEVGALSVPMPSGAESDLQIERAQTTVGTRGPALIVDALFGTGLARPMEGLKPLTSEIQMGCEADSDHWWPRVVAVDIASGLCADSGRVIGGEDGAAIGAHLTVTFHSMKLGHMLDAGPEFCGRLVVCSIGLEDDWIRNRKALADLHGMSRPARIGKVVASLVDTTRPHPDVAKSSGHKYSHGHALILSGASAHGGAARLAARGALRIGAGLVTVGCPPDALAENAARLDAVMVRAVADGAALAAVLQDARINALCLGPGLGAERARALVSVALGSGEQPRATVLDADALTTFARDPEALFAMLHERCVLTPHGGEFARLFPDIAERLAAVPTKGPAYSKVDATREAAARAGCVVLFKGPDTVIASPDGGCSINSAAYERAAPWLATAGSGDVLAGFITGLLARGFAPKQAAETAAWLHVECARSFGPGLIAEDLPDELPKVFRQLGV